MNPTARIGAGAACGEEPEWVEPMPFTVRTADGQVADARRYYRLNMTRASRVKPGQHAKAGRCESDDARGLHHHYHTPQLHQTRAEEVHGRPLPLTFDGIWQGQQK